MSQATPRADATLPHRFGLPLPALAFGQLRFWLVVAATLHAIANPVSAQPWYEHYEQADRARAMSRRLLKFSGGAVDDDATFSTATASPSC